MNTTQPSLMTRLFTCLLTVLAPVYWELTLHLFVYHQLTWRIAYPLLFSLTAGIGVYVLSSLFPKKVNTGIACTLTGLICLYFEVQLVYRSIFGEFMPVFQLLAQTDAVTNFFRSMLYGISQVILQILVLLLPFASMVLLCWRKRLNFQRCRPWQSALLAAALVAVHFGAYGIMYISSKQPFSVYQLYANPNTSTEISVKNIGLLSTLRLETKRLLHPVATASQRYGALGEKWVDPGDKAYQMMDLDFDVLASSTENPALQALDAYFATVEPDTKNAYTGMLKDYNLVVFCAESFSPLLIDPERTPALYQLSTGGFIFENYFGSYGSNTTNGEYTLCMGLYPDLSRDRGAASFFASKANYLPFCLGNQFSRNGAQAWAYHNYLGDYYDRIHTHPNMGYTFKAPNAGLDIQLTSPSSDLEMVEKTVDDYLSENRQFIAYYMTYSGHYPYTWDNAMSAKNREMAQDLPYSETVQAYIACNQELELALEYLLQRLEDTGVADKTVIVLTNDHYPYGLSESEYNELAGQEIDPTFEKYRSSFICYVPGIQPQVVDTYCSTVDILPTLLNLFGLEYDARLLVGQDVFSPSNDQMAVLSDQSFITADYAFDASTGSVTPYTDAPVEDADVQRRLAAISLQMQLSTDILNTNYYAHVFPGQQNDIAPETELPFTDVSPNFYNLCIEYLWSNGYIDGLTDTYFGYEDTTTYGDLLSVLYRLAGSPNGDGQAVSWAEENHICQEGVGEDAVLTRADIAAALRRFAIYLGYPAKAANQDAVQQQRQTHPELDYDTVDGLCWLLERQIMTGATGMLSDLVAVCQEPVTRFQMASIVYHFWQSMENSLPKA